MTLLHSLETRLLISRLDEAKRKHYDFLCQLDLSDLTDEARKQDQERRSEIKEIDMEIRSRFKGEFIDSPSSSWAI